MVILSRNRSQFCNYICYINVILLLINFESCKTQHENLIFSVDKEWKNKAISKLNDEYKSYIEKMSDDTISDFNIDLNYKIQDIRRYPFGSGLKLIKNKIQADNILFDSVVCLTTQFIGFDPEILTGNIYFIFKNNEIVYAFQHDIVEQRLEKRSENINQLKEFYNNQKLKENGQNRTLIIITNFSKTWEFIIAKIVINSAL